MSENASELLVESSSTSKIVNEVFDCWVGCVERVYLLLDASASPSPSASSDPNHRLLLREEQDWICASVTWRQVVPLILRRSPLANYSFLSEGSSRGAVRLEVIQRWSRGPSLPFIRTASFLHNSRWLSRRRSNHDSSRCFAHRNNLIVLILVWYLIVILICNILW